MRRAAVTGSGGLFGWAPQANGIVGVRALALDADNDTLVAGGDFTQIGGRTRKRVAVFR